MRTQMAFVATKLVISVILLMQLCVPLEGKCAGSWARHACAGGNKKRAPKSEAGHPFQQLRSRMKALLKPETNLVLALSALRKDLVPRMLPDVAYYKVVSSLGGPPSNTATKTNTVVNVYHTPGRETDFNVRMTEGRNADDKDASGGTNRQKQDGGQGINGGQKGDDGKEDHSDDVIDQIDDKETDRDNWEAMTRQLRRLHPASSSNNSARHHGRP